MYDLPVSHRAAARRRRLAALGAGTSLAVAVALVTIPAQAQAKPTATASAARNAVVSGDARFEVLSPTLIRTEYAGDASFEDASTFNAIGRNNFGRTHFTTKTVNGWLTIRTSAATLRYKVGSGKFTADNLKLEVRTGKQQVNASPWESTGVPTCIIGRLCEAEDLQLDGLALATDHKGSTGRGFVAGFTHVGNSMTFDVNASQASTYDIALRYANSTGGDGQNVTRTLSVSVDGGDAHTISLPTTGSWDTWSVARASLDLPAGSHTVTIERDASDSGNVNIDSLAVVAPDAPYPGSALPPSSPCAFGSICEADTGTLLDGAKKASDHNGYSGDGFVAGLERAGAGDRFSITGVPRAGTYDLQLRYSNWQSGSQPIQSRKVSVTANAADPTTATLAPTSSWDTWRTVSVPVKLTAGDNTVELGCPDASSCRINLDTVAVTRTSSPLLAPHAPLGGYRRGLDGVDGSAITAPGLLYQDGWSLLNDTASAIYDPATEKVTQRPDKPGTAYQDGYVFAYGQNYTTGLRDLSTLTGPSELLPRWAYGLWYSEYYDRSAADYENTILPKFRSEGVPLDVLVTDTDFKTPNTWDGWEIDKSKFPDPAAYFSWAHSQGLHTALNIHPSIVASDPQFAQAQATAKGTLTSGGCGGGVSDCYVFDFGDADQLKAYLGLHKSMEQAGNDLWWLDWCCDQSYSSLKGVTPDAWIAQKYADDTDSRVGRGFAFSRAYGSLQAGGYSNPVAVPTGPWADKRTTLHFTGDTTSDWQTLKFEIGYTGGESVATGMSNISDDIGGFTGGLKEPGTEPGSTKLPDDLYARWVQMGTFQPIDRLHSNHSDRLPWQYGDAAKASAEKFLNLRENLVPYTYTLAQQATATGTPIVQPLYLDYPEQQEAYANTDSEYLYGPDVLVAPVSTAGTTATTHVWFPAGSTWTDYFTGKTYQGGTTADITTGLDTMPVFIKSGGIMTTRTNDVTNDEQNPLDAVTATVAEGSNGSFTLYEDDGTTTNARQHATTRISYRRTGKTHRVTVDPAEGRFHGQVAKRAWTVSFRNASAPRDVTINGHRVAASAWTWDASTKTLTIRAPQQAVNRKLEISYR